MRPASLPMQASGASRATCGRRVAPLAAFATSQDPRVVPLRNNPSTMVIQNDGDEMMTGPAALHITRREARAPPPYYAPCSSYKLNTEWVQVRGHQPLFGSWTGKRKHFTHSLLPGPSLMHAYTHRGTRKLFHGAVI